MNRLQAELRRLYLLGDPAADGADAGDFALASPKGDVRAMVLELASPANWTALSVLWRKVQADMELPAPAIAISGTDGFQLWFSVSEPVSTTDARRFLESLRLRFLSDIAPERIDLMPSIGDPALGPVRHAKLVPALADKADQWSAYVAPDLAAVFADEPWLDICPSPDAQAEVLSRLASIKIASFRSILGQLDMVENARKNGTTPAVGNGDSALRTSNTAGAQSATAIQNPKQFLLAIMGDKTVEMHLRIQAAQALLPYF